MEVVFLLGIIEWIFKIVWLLLMVLAIVGAIILDEISMGKKIFFIILSIICIISQIYSWFIINRKGK